MEIPEHIASDLSLGLEDIARWVKREYALACPEKDCESQDVSVSFSNDRRIEISAKLHATSMICQVCGKITSLNGNGNGHH